jgi:hypothetical protein
VKNATPLRLVQAILLGSLLIVASYAADWMPFDPPNPKHGGLWMILWDLHLALLVEFIPFCIGAALIWRAYVLLAKGMRLETWTEDERTAARRWGDTRLRNWYIVPLLSASIVIWTAGLLHHDHWNALVLMWLANPLIRVRGLLKPPRPGGAQYDWRRDQKPFYSNHWGEPPAAHGGTG